MKIVVLGGGLTGLMAAFVLRKFGDVTLIDERQRIGAPNSGLLRHLRRTSAMGDLLDSLGVLWKAWRLRGGILLDGEIRPYPVWMRQMPDNERLQLQKLYWERTRGSLPKSGDDDVARCMGNPMEDPEMAINLDREELARLLAHRAIRDDVLFIPGSKVVNITERQVMISPPLWWRRSPQTVEIDYDHLIMTLPLPVASELAPWACLPAPAIGITTLLEYALPDLLVSALDYVYTPTLSTVTKVSWPRRGTLLAEAPGIVDPSKVETDLREPLFPLSCRRPVMADEPTYVRRHISKLDTELAWPEHWFPLGRYAEWEPSRTTEQSLDRVLSWSQLLARSSPGPEVA